MKTMPRAERIRSALETAFAAARVSVRDDSALHVGHEGARGGAGHFHVRVESQSFAGQSRLQRHRMIYEALAEMLQGEIHALNIEAISPEDDTSQRTK